MESSQRRKIFTEVAEHGLLMRKKDVGLIQDRQAAVELKTTPQRTA